MNKAEMLVVQLEGQLEESLNQIVLEIRELEAERDNWREKYIASLNLNDDLIKGVERLRAQAWEEGWEAAWTPMSQHHKDQGPNPYRSKE